MCFLVVTTALAVTVWIFRQFERELVAQKARELDHDAFYLGIQFRDQIQDLKEDSNFLAGTPPIQGIVRALKSSTHVDPVDGSSLDVWRDRLTIIFTQLLRAKADYLQIRFIGLADGGMELVRLDRGGPAGTIRDVPADELQPKGDTSYFRSAVRHGRNQTSLSGLDLNRERGEITDPPVPVLRASTPIYAPNGALFGIVVINKNMQEIFTSLATVAHSGRSYYLSNNNGDYLIHPDRSKTFRFEYNEASRIQDDFPMLAGAFGRDNIVELTGMHALDDGKRLAYHLQKINYDPLTPGNLLGIMVTDDFTDAAVVSDHVLKHAYLIIGILIVLAIGLGAVFTKRLTTPFIDITHAVERFGTGSTIRNLPVNAFGEAGVLARAFQRMVAAVEEHTFKLENEALERKKAELHAVAIFDNATDGIITIDKRGAVTRINPAAETMFGYAADDILGENVKLLMPPSVRDRHDGYLDNYLRTGKKTFIGTRREIVAVRNDGSAVTLELAVSESHSGDTITFTGIFRDISDRKQAEAALRHSHEELSRSNAELERIAYVSAHDLREPIRALASCTQMLKRRVGAELDDASRELMDHIVDAARRMSDLVDDLRSFIELGRRECKLRSVDAGAAWASVVNDLKVEIERIGARVTAEALPVVRADEKMLKQMLTHLIANAIRHRCPDRPVTIHCRARKHEGNWEFLISDTGPGIPAKFHQEIFVFFKRLHNDPLISGNGVGLALCKNIVDKHGGRIWVESEIGAGTTVIFTLSAIGSD